MNKNTKASGYCLDTQEERRLLRLQIMGLGGLSLASKESGMNYWRLSRLLNGWVTPTKKDMTLLTEYLRKGRSIFETGLLQKNVAAD